MEYALFQGITPFSEGVITFARDRYIKNTLVRRLMEDAGIAAARITVTDMSNMDPANTRDSEISRAQNRRVTFEIN
mgnify:CR=1 FL=1